MDDGEIELSDPALLPNTSSSSIIDEFLKHSRPTCTHTHTCNPPGPDATHHTHTCYHTHTQVFSSEDTKTRSEASSVRPRKPLGNREAVRKYREKKKAHTAHLEEEVKKLRGLNQQLARRLQGQAALEAELLRLRTLLGEIRGKIDVELSSFSFGKYCGSDDNAVGLMCEAPIPCFQSIGDIGGEGGDKGVFSWGGDCQPAIVECHVNDENQGQ